MSNPFKKFSEKGDSGAKKKERIRQEKKQARKETQEFFAKKKEEAKMMRAQGGITPTRHKSNEETRSQGSGFKSKGGRSRTEDTRHKAHGSGYKSQSAKPQRQQSNETTGYKKTEETRKTPFAKGGRSEAGTDYKSQGGRSRIEDTRHKAQGTGYKSQGAKKSFDTEKKQDAHKVQKGAAQPQTSNRKQQTTSAQSPSTESKLPAGSMPLNKFIAHSGICSRRDAAEMVKAGKVTVNGEHITEPGHKVTDKDNIKVNGKQLQIRRNLVYILINKPKDFITTTEDPQGRKTVLDIIRNATPERVYPIGRLDRNTTGVLLLTNDGELAQKLSHPSYEIKKIYEVRLDKPLVKKDFETIVNGITLEDGFIAPDTLAYADPKDKSVIGIEIHSGRNRIVRRIFEHLGYDVRNLDRVMYANLTKKNVDRGKWRFLTEKEVRLLKYLNASYTKNKPATRG